MRTFAVLAAAVLLLIGVVGVGLSTVLVLIAAGKAAPGHGWEEFVLGVYQVATGFTAGTVALAGAGMIFATLGASDERLTELRALHRLAAEAEKRELVRDGRDQGREMQTRMASAQAVP